MRGAAAAPLQVSDMRISYERGNLDEARFRGRDPMAVFDEWFKAAVDGKVCEEPNAISLASADTQGRPSVRVVLLKGYDERGEHRQGAWAWARMGGQDGAAVGQTPCRKHGLAGSARRAVAILTGNKISSGVQTCIHV